MSKGKKRGNGRNHDLSSSGIYETGFMTAPSMFTYRIQGTESNHSATELSALYDCVQGITANMAAQLVSNYVCVTDRPVVRCMMDDVLTPPAMKDGPILRRVGKIDALYRNMFREKGVPSPTIMNWYCVDKAGSAAFIMINNIDPDYQLYEAHILTMPVGNTYGLLDTIAVRVATSDVDHMRTYAVYCAEGASPVPVLLKTQDSIMNGSSPFTSAADRLLYYLEALSASLSDTGNDDFDVPFTEAERCIYTQMSRDSMSHLVGQRVVINHRLMNPDASQIHEVDDRMRHNIDAMTATAAEDFFRGSDCNIPLVNLEQHERQRIKKFIEDRGMMIGSNIRPFDLRDMINDPIAGNMICYPFYDWAEKKARNMLVRIQLLGDNDDILMVSISDPQLSSISDGVIYTLSFDRIDMFLGWANLRFVDIAYFQNINVCTLHNHPSDMLRDETLKTISSVEFSMALFEMIGMYIVMHERADDLKIVRITRDSSPYDLVAREIQSATNAGAIEKHPRLEGLTYVIE